MIRFARSIICLVRRVRGHQLRHLDGLLVVRRPCCGERDVVGVVVGRSSASAARLAECRVDPTRTAHDVSTPTASSAAQRCREPSCHPALPCVPHAAAILLQRAMLSHQSLDALRSGARCSSRKRLIDASALHQAAHRARSTSSPAAATSPTASRRPPPAACCGRSAWRTTTSPSRRSASASSWNEITPCNLSLDRLAKAVKDGVFAAGGYPDGVRHDLGVRRHLDGPRGHALLAGVPRGDRRQRRDGDAGRAAGRLGAAGRLRQVAARHADGRRPARPARRCSSTPARSCRAGPSCPTAPSATSRSSTRSRRSARARAG